MDPLFDVLALSLWPWLRVGFRWAVDGRESIPTKGPALLVSNHISYLDGLVAGSVAFERGRRARFLTKSELFRPPLGWVLRALGQIKVERGTGTAADSLAEAARALGRGECVVIFPEGTISEKTFEPMAFRTGAARLMQRTGVPVVPMAIWGPHRVLTKGRAPAPRLGIEVRVRVGEPLSVVKGESVVAGSRRLRRAVVRCLREAQSSYSQQPGPEEDDWWVARVEGSGQ
jgi:1-acyl-sn-glycerol-3-phosphate acyltransferase